MPYVTETIRKELDSYICESNDLGIVNLDNFVQTILDSYPENKLAGIANYLITKIVAKLILRGKYKNYNRINSAIGVLECTKMELYRRVAAPYEDLAIAKNGDIEAYKPSA